MNETNLVDAIGPLVSGRFYPDVAPANAVTPFATYQQVGGQPVNYIEGVASDKKNARIQINVWAKTRAEVNTLMRQIEDVAVASPLFGFVDGALIARYDEATKLRGAHQDFSFWISP